MSSKLYNQQFYAHRDARTRNSARVILEIVKGYLPSFESVVDVGCGVGAWLAASLENGAETVQGVDGPWVDQSLLQIPAEDFLAQSLEERVSLDKRYDLAISLEVAEHLSPERAGSFVEDLTGLSDFVLFSAAIPGQGGKGHVNEQWPSYWWDLFRQHGYVALDLVRDRVWGNPSIPYWYQQNCLLYVAEGTLADLGIQLSEKEMEMPPKALVHPELFEKRVSECRSLRGSWRAFRRALLRRQ